MMFIRKLTILFAMLLALSASADSGISRGDELVRTSIVSDHVTFQPATIENRPSAKIGVRFVIEPGWHIYWRNSGEAAIPTEVKWNLPEGWRVGELQWPAPYKFIEKGDIITYGYQNEVLLYADLFNPEEVPTADSWVTVNADVEFLVCKDICVPGSAHLNESFDYSITKPLQPSSHYDLFARYEALTPKPLTALNGIPGLRDITVAVGATEAKGGAKTRIAHITLSNLNEAQLSGIASRLQLFPFAYEDLEISSSRVFTDSVEREAQINFELKPVTGTKVTTSEVSGVLLLSCAICGLDRDIPVEWRIDLGAPGVDAGQIDDGEGEPLTLRTVVHEEESTGAPLSESKSRNWLYALLSAFIAGVILNFMPCVLPVISLKVFGFLEQSGGGRAAAFRNASAFAAGIIAAFMALAGTIIGLKQIGLEVGWGFQFQYPGFVFTLTLIVFVLALGFFELYTVNLPGTQRANRAADRFGESKLAKHFFDGVLATILATPCSAPLLGTALAFAFTQSAGATVAIFFMIGLGLSTPYVLLATNQRLLNFLPRPGEWMNTFKQFMGFLMLGTVIWLLYVLQSESPLAVIPTLFLLLALFFLFWLRQILSTHDFWSHHLRWLSTLTALLFVALCFKSWQGIATLEGGNLPSAPSAISWRPYSTELIEAEGAKGNVVFIDFTAQWCITCKFNERFVISSDGVQKLFKDLEVTPVKADWTSRDELISAALKRYRGTGVPYYVVMGPGLKEPLILPTLLTTGIIEDGLRQAAG